MAKLQFALERSWRTPNLLTVALWPLSILYRVVIGSRRWMYERSLFQVYRAPIPVIVIGNLTVGGSGKTPLVIHLIEKLIARGFKPAVISRGYRAEPPGRPFLVTADSPVIESGDEPGLIARRTGVPVMIGADRVESVKTLLGSHDVDVIVSDDGLQHLALARDIEICLSNTQFESGNTLLLPAGPYREPRSRLEQMDYVVHDTPHSDVRYFCQQTNLGDPVSLVDSEWPFDDSLGLHLVAGIANPQRFFEACEARGWRGYSHSFPDHHRFQPGDIDFGDELPILMTEKDAIKCQEFADSRHWKVPLNVTLQPDLSAAICARLHDEKVR